LSAYKNGELKKIIDDELLQIDTAIFKEKGIGTRKVIYDLRTSYTEIYDLGKEDIEIIVYNEIITSLKDRGFDVKIEFRGGKQCNRLHISWVICLSEELRKKMLSRLTKHKL
jgi:hypothetical protein